MFYIFLPLPPLVINGHFFPLNHNMLRLSSWVLLSPTTQQCPTFPPGKRNIYFISSRQPSVSPQRSSWTVSFILIGCNNVNPPPLVFPLGHAPPSPHLSLSYFSVSFHGPLFNVCAGEGGGGRRRGLKTTLFNPALQPLLSC